MLPDTWTLGASRLYEKVDADPTLYKDGDSPRALPATLSVQHSAGKGGSPVRHLIQIRRPIKDATNAYTGEYVTINCTVTYPNVAYGETQVNEAALDMAFALGEIAAGVIVMSENLTLVLDGHN